LFRTDKLLSDKSFWQQCAVVTAPLMDAPSETRCKRRVTLSTQLR